MDKKTVAEIVAAVAEQGMDGAFGDVQNAISNGWGDWFCSDKALKNRSKKFMGILNRITGNGKISLDDKVTLLNCCSEYLYDRMILDNDDHTMSIENDPEEYRARWAVVIMSGGPESGPSVVKFKNVHALVAWLNEPWKN
jgi:hypothetical protein